MVVCTYRSSSVIRTVWEGSSRLPGFRITEWKLCGIGNIQKESLLKAVAELQSLNTALSSKIIMMMIMMIIIIIIGLFHIISP